MDIDKEIDRELVDKKEWPAYGDGHTIMLTY